MDLFEVMEMSIHCPANSFKELIPFFGLNAGKSINLYLKNCSINKSLLNGQSSRNDLSKENTLYERNSAAN